MATNQTMFNRMYESTTPGISGEKFDGVLITQTRAAVTAANGAKESADDLRDRFSAGVAGVRFEGDLYAFLRRIEQVCITNTSVIQNLVAALSNVTQGAAFNEEKLMAGIAATVQENLPEQNTNELETV